MWYQESICPLRVNELNVYCEIGWVEGSLGFDPAPRARQMWAGHRPT